jgi:hypothetical protein
VLDSRGMLYYYRKQWGKPTVSVTQISLQLTLLSLLKNEKFPSFLHPCRDVSRFCSSLILILLYINSPALEN